MTKGLLDTTQNNDNFNTNERLISNSEQDESGLLELTTHSKKDTNEKCKTVYRTNGGLLDVETE